ncbi:hypothetical protein BKA93DRAFT_541061 [Sparassis latifolia]
MTQADMPDKIWVASPPPQEDWGDDPDTQWAVKGIVSDDIDAFGAKRTCTGIDRLHLWLNLPGGIQQIKWADWHREDGTSTTWGKHQPDMEKMIEEWNKNRENNWLEMAKESLEIPVALEPSQQWHDALNAERGHGYAEKDTEAQRVGLRKYAGWANIRCPGDDGDGDSDEPAVGSRARLRARPASVSALSNHAAQSTSNRPVPTSPVSRSVASPLPSVGLSPDRNKSNTLASTGSTPLSSRQRSSTAKVSSASPAVNDIALEPMKRPMKPLPRRIISPLPPIVDRRAKLQEKWSNVARGFGAAPVRIVNDVNDEDIPPGLESFTYREYCYVHSPEVLVSDMTDCVVSCDCENGCTNAWGLFKFNVPPGVEVIECNKKCSCYTTRKCPNRVAQTPREVPIEIFRTRDCGWGVRCPVDLVRGKVLGVYTGELITRRQAHQRSDDHKSYIFDLDVHEDGSEDAKGLHFYSVDSYIYGNWTRFLNHSCEPNARVYPVIWDTIPEVNQPYLAIVTTRAVPAGTELTIDYDPKAATSYTKGKGKGKDQIPPGARFCACGAADCRGWVRV